jgi:hypothetical protein
VAGLATLTLFAVACLIVGVVAATGSPLLVLVVLGLLLSVVFLLLPTLWQLIALFIFSFVVTGSLVYFAKLSQALWIPYLIGAVLYVRVLTLALKVQHTPTRFPRDVIALCIFVAVFFVSAVMNGTGAKEMLVSGKTHLFLWSVLLLCAAGVRNPKVFETLWRSLFIIAGIQLPVVIYQYTRSGIHAWDAVSGTLGGSETGGNSASMGLLLVITALVALVMRQERAISRRTLMLVGLLCVVPIALAEVKAIVLVFMPLAFLLLYYREIVARPLKFAVGSLAVIALVGAVSFGYQQLHYKQANSRNTLVETFDRAFALDVDSQGLRRATGELGRLALLNFWWQENRTAGLERTLLGYGPGACRISGFYVGAVRAKYPFYKLDRHAASVLLWEFGVLGYGAFLALLICGALTSFRLSKSVSVPSLHRGYLRVGGATLLLFAAATIYGRFMIDLASMQLLMTYCLGQAAYWHSRGATTNGAACGLDTAPAVAHV